MKKRKILVLFPLLGLLLSGCTFQEGYTTTKNWISDHIIQPIKNLFNKNKGSGGNDSGKDSGGDSGKTDPGTAQHAGTMSDPFTAADANAIAAALGDGAYSSSAYYVKGVVQEATFGGDQFGNFDITIEDGFIGYRMKNGETKASFHDGDIVQDDIVLMYGKIKNFKGTYELDGTNAGGAYVVSVERPAPTDAELTSISIEGSIKTDYVVGEKFGHAGLTVTAHYADQKTQNVTSLVEWSYSQEAAVKGQTSVTITASYKGKTASITPQITVADAHAGTEDDPLNGAEANAIASGLASGSYSDQAYYIKGVVQSIDEAFNSEYGNYSFSIEDGFKGYRMKKANNTSFSEGDVAVGYTVLMYGKIKNFNGTYELDGTKNGGAYVVSVIEEVVEPESVSLSLDTVEMQVDDLVTLEAYVHPDEANQKVNWTVDQEGDIISFNQETGVITGLAVGSATITATSVENANAHASCSITVSEKTKELSDIEIDTSKVKVQYNVGENYSYDGIVVTAKYSNAEDQVVTAGATISCDKVSASALDDSLSITVSYGGIEKVVVLAVQVSAKSQLQVAYEAGEALTDKTDSGETKYEFSGVVVATRGTNDYFVQNGSYGIDLYQPGSVSGLAVGKNVTVTAPMKKYNGTIETGSNPTVVVGETATSLPNPVVIDSAATFETLKQNILVNITGVATNAVAATGNQTLTLDVNGDLIPVYLHSSIRSASGLTALNDVQAGDTVTITNAVSGVYQTTKQVLPCADSVATVVVKQVSSIVSAVGPTNVPLNGQISASDVTVMAIFEGESEARQAVVTSVVSADTSSGGDHTGTVMIHGYSQAVPFTYSVANEEAQTEEIVLDFSSAGYTAFPSESVDQKIKYTYVKDTGSTNPTFTQASGEPQYSLKLYANNYLCIEIDTTGASDYTSFASIKTKATSKNGTTAGSGAFYKDDLTSTALYTHSLQTASFTDSEVVNVNGATKIYIKCASGQYRIGKFTLVLNK